MTLRVSYDRPPARTTSVYQLSHGRRFDPPGEPLIVTAGPPLLWMPRHTHWHMPRWMTLRNGGKVIRTAWWCMSPDGQTADLQCVTSQVVGRDRITWEDTIAGRPMDGCWACALAAPTRYLLGTRGTFSMLRHPG